MNSLLARLKVEKAEGALVMMMIIIIIIIANAYMNLFVSDGYGTIDFLHQFSNCQNSFLNIWLLECLHSSPCLRNMNPRKILWKLKASLFGTFCKKRLGQKRPKLVFQSLVSRGSDA